MFQQNLFWLVAIWFLSVVPSVEAQQTKAVPKIGYLSASTRTSHAQSYHAFQQGLRELGYMEGRNIAVEARFAEGKADRLPQLVSELIGLQVDLLLVGGSEAVRPARDATKTIPIVVAHFEDPVAEGFVTSLARPGGNITGLSRMSSDLAGKRLELLKEAVPSIRRIGVLLNPGNPPNLLHIKEGRGSCATTRSANSALGGAARGGDWTVLARAIVDRIDALIPSVDRIFDTPRAKVLDFAIKNRLPTMYHNSRTVEQGRADVLRS